MNDMLRGYVLIAIGIILSAMIWWMTYRRYPGFLADILRLLLTAALTGAIILDWGSSVTVVHALEIMFTEHWVAGPLIIFYWFLVIGALFFIGRMVQREFCAPSRN